MGKPFRVESRPVETDIGRLPNGQFTRIIPPNPAQIVKRAREEGVEIQDIVEDVRAPMHPTASGARNGQELPRGEPGPHNDSAKLPMKLDR